MIREGYELLAKLALLNGDMTSLGSRFMEGSAGAGEQARYTQRMISLVDG